MIFGRSAAGMLEVELTSAGMEASLAGINAQGIEMMRLNRIDDLTCRFRIRRADYSALAALCKKRGETLRILKKTGLYWTVKALTKRPALLAGGIMLLITACLLPTRVLFVQVEGNRNVPQRRILAAAEDCGISFGASRREVRSEKMKNALLSAVPELEWAGVNTAGCVATISVREAAEPETMERKNAVSNMVALRDGYILSGTVTQGTALFQPGQTVKAGQILISGYTDCGICIQAGRAEGEVYAQTKRDLMAVTPSQYVKRGKHTAVKRKISIVLRKKRINLWKDSGISEGSCGRMYEEYYVTLPGGFQLPLALCVETYICYQEQTEKLSELDAEEALADFAQQYVLQQTVAGKIVRKTQYVSLQDGIYSFWGNYVCEEMIGREQQEQIGDTNGKNG